MQRISLRNRGKAESMKPSARPGARSMTCNTGLPKAIADCDRSEINLQYRPAKGDRGLRSQRNQLTLRLRNGGALQTRSS
jgi:hypothetical protein